MSTIEPIHSGLRFHVIEGESIEATYPLEKALISIGRATPETINAPGYITFPEPTVSRLHAVLTWEEGAKAYLLHHRSQTNPTIVNNAVINTPQLLKLGDRITLGRLILLVEAEPPATSSETQPPLEVSQPASLEKKINAFVKSSQRMYSAPIKENTILLRFQNERTTASVDQDNSKYQEIILPAAAPSTLRLKLDPESLDYKLESEPYNQTKTARISKGRNDTELRVNLRTGYTLAISKDDAILHQDYVIWIGDPDLPPYQEPVAIGSSEESEAPEIVPRVGVIFRSGPWKGATITAASSGLSSISLGAGDIGFKHVLPITDAPSCEIVINNGSARLRATEIAGEQYIEVDDRSMFIGEDAPLRGGSIISLGSWEFSWDDGLSNNYSSYTLKEQESGCVHLVEKATVRIGTASHCEIVIANKKLPPVAGYITFEGKGPVYHHQDLSCGILVDGQQIESGLSAQLKPGSILELRAGVTLHLEKSE